MIQEATLPTAVECSHSSDLWCPARACVCAQRSAASHLDMLVRRGNGPACSSCRDDWRPAVSSLLSGARVAAFLAVCALSFDTHSLILLVGVAASAQPPATCLPLGRGVGGHCVCDPLTVCQGSYCVNATANAQLDAGGDGTVPTCVALSRCLGTRPPVSTVRAAHCIATTQRNRQQGLPLLWLSDGNC